MPEDGAENAGEAVTDGAENVGGVVTDGAEDASEAAAAESAADNGEGAPESSEGSPKPEKKPKKKVSIKDIVAFAQNHIFTPRVCNIILLCLGIAITALCAAQLVLWALTIKDEYLNIWTEASEVYSNCLNSGEDAKMFDAILEAIKGLDVVRLVVVAFVTLFLVVLLINIIQSIISMIKKGHEVRFAAVSTIFAFYVFSVFATDMISDYAGVISEFSFSPFLKILLILTLVYALVRLFVKDLATRIAPIAFACGAGIVAILMFSQSVGSFAEFTLFGNGVKMSELNMFEYIRSVLAVLSDGVDLNVGNEWYFFGYGMKADPSIASVNGTITAILLQFVPIMVANLLPYMAISLLGYLVYVLVGRDYVQYHYLHACKKISVTMLVVSLFSLAATVGLYFVFQDSSIGFEIDYINAGVTTVLCVVMIVITSLPWKIYKTVFKHRYAAYLKSEGGNR